MHSNVLCNYAFAMHDQKNASFCCPVILGVWGMFEAMHARAQNSPRNITAYLGKTAKLSCFHTNGFTVFAAFEKKWAHTLPWRPT